MSERSSQREIQSVFELLQVVKAWSPSMPTDTHWHKWAEGNDGLAPFALDEKADEKAAQQPDVSFLPLALRKRLSPLSKVSLYLIHHCLEQSEKKNIRVVMSSRFGEAQTTVALLEAIARDEQSSPMAFSRSVHNSSIGLFSIAEENVQTNTAVSAMEYSFGMGLIEAVSQLYKAASTAPKEEAHSVLYLYADEAVPEAYTAFVQEPPVHFGAAFLLQYQPSAVPMSELLHGLHEIECLEFLQFALASC